MAEPVISEYKSVYHKYLDCVKVIAKREIHSVFKWLYQGGDLYVGDYMKTFSGSMNHLYKEEKKMLEERVSTEEMDITLLYQLLRYTCGLSEADGNIWHKPETSQVDSIEHTLYLLKELRNQLDHKDFKIRKLPESEILEKTELVRKFCIKILNEAGERSARLAEAADAIDEMEKDLCKIMGMTPTLLATLGKQEKKNGNSLDLGWYCSPIMYHKEELLPISNFLSVRIQDEKRSSVIIVTGDAGTGKSSLCQYLDWLWITEKSNILDLQGYDLLLVINCREVCTRDLVCLLKDDLLPDAMSWCNPYKITELMDSLKILWIMDGLEEATPEATDIIHKLMRKQNVNYTFVITSRPEHKYSLTAPLKPHEYIEISLQGVDPTNVFEKLQESPWCSDYSVLDLQNFANGFRNLSEDVKAELSNPLKLHLAMNHWKSCFKELQYGSSLSQLYETIKEHQIETLANKLAEGNVSKKDAEGKVKEWFRFLCQISFEMTASRTLTEIDKKRLDRLEKKCNNLAMPSPDKCLSSFLTHKGPGIYSFFHPSQQYFYSAIHGVSIINGYQGLAELLKSFGIFPSNTDEKGLAHFYEALLHMVSMLQKSISKKKAEDLVTLLDYAITGEHASLKWFEVMKAVSNRRKFVIHISELIPNIWLIGDQNITAAEHLLEYTTPQRIRIQIQENPKLTAGLESLLRKIACTEKPIYVELYLNYHLTNLSNMEMSDEFLQLLCSSESTCIIGFSGQLSKDGYKLLQSCNVQDYCHMLRLKLKTSDCLSPLCYHAQFFQVIKTIELTFDFLTYRSVAIKSRLPNCSIDVILPKILDNQVERAVNIVCCVAKCFSNIIVRNVSQMGVAKFVHLLNRKEVQAKALKRLLLNQSQGRGYLADFGPLPLKYSMDQFKGHWINSEKLLTLEIRNPQN